MKTKKVKKISVVWDWCDYDILACEYFPSKKRTAISQKCINVNATWIPINRVVTK
jgi:hypothetical protein